MKILDLQDICMNAMRDTDFSFNSLDLLKTSDYFIFKSLNNFSDIKKVFFNSHPAKTPAA